VSASTSVPVVPARSAPPATDPGRRAVPWSARLLAGVVLYLVLLVVVGEWVDDYWLFLATAALISALVVIGLNLSFGYTGQLNLAIGAFYALGAYSAVAASDRMWDPLLTLLVALVASAVLAVGVGLVSFRARGFYFALITAGISLLAYNLIVEWDSMTGGLTGATVAQPLSVGGVDVVEPTDFYRLAGVLVLLALVGVSVARRRGTLGRWEAVREDEVLASSLGVNPLVEKIEAFVAGAMIATLAGTVFAYFSIFVAPESFDFFPGSFQPVLMLVLGGSGTLIGPVVGAVLVTVAPEVLRPLADYRQLVYAAVLLVVIMVAPRGLVGTVTSAVAQLRRRTRSGPEEGR
jgi:branched-chain amino acid transport system permease protein